MRINKISNQVSVCKAKNNDKSNYHSDSLPNNSNAIAFKGNRISLFKRFFSKKFDHDFLPRTADKAIEYLQACRKITFDSDLCPQEDIGSINVYKNIKGKTAKIHEYIFIKGAINEPDTLSISDAYNHKTLKREKTYHFRKDDDVEKRTLLLKRIFYKKQRFVPLLKRTPKDHNIRISEHYRPDETLDFVVEYDRLGNVTRSKYYDNSGKKVIRKGAENPSEYP